MKRKRNAHPKRTSPRERSSQTTWIRPVCISCVIGVGVWLLILMIAAFAMTKIDSPQMLVTPVSILSVVLGAFFAGFACAKMIRERGFLWGLLCGGILCVILLAANVIVCADGFGVIWLIKVACILLASTIGGMLGVNSRRKIRK